MKRILIEIPSTTRVRPDELGHLCLPHGLQIRFRDDGNTELWFGTLDGYKRAGRVYIDLDGLELRQHLRFKVGDVVRVKKTPRTGDTIAGNHFRIAQVRPDRVACYHLDTGGAPFWVRETDVAPIKEKK